VAPHPPNESKWPFQGYFVRVLWFVWGVLAVMELFKSMNFFPLLLYPFGLFKPFWRSDPGSTPLASGWLFFFPLVLSVGLLVCGACTYFFLSFFLIIPGPPDPHSFFSSSFFFLSYSQFSFFCVFSLPCGFLFRVTLLDFRCDHARAVLRWPPLPFFQNWGW